MYEVGLTMHSFTQPAGESMLPIRNHRNKPHLGGLKTDRTAVIHGPENEIWHAQKMDAFVSITSASVSDFRTPYGRNGHSREKITMSSVYDRFVAGRHDIQLSLEDAGSVIKIVPLS